MLAFDYAKLHGSISTTMPDKIDEALLKRIGHGKDGIGFLIEVETVAVCRTPL